MSNNLHHVENLLRMVADKDATIDRQAAQLVEYAKMLDDERAAVSVLRESIVQLRAQLNAVPMDCIRRYHACTHYDAAAANDVEYTTQQFDSDDMWIGMWLESLEDVA